MKLLLAALALVAAFHADAVTRTYVWYTNTWNDAADIVCGRFRFPDGSWTDTSRQMTPEPLYYPNGKTAVKADGTTKTFNVPLLFANGRAIQIEAHSNDTRKAVVSWAQYTKLNTATLAPGSTLPVATPNLNRHSMEISSDTYVFAGGDGSSGTDANFCNGSVTLFGGTVAKIYGGCLFNGVVSTSTITIAPRSKVTEIYGGNEGAGLYGKNVLASNVNRCFVGNCTIRVHLLDDDPEIDRIAGGGHSIADVGVVDILITGGKVKIVTVGSTSGMVGYSKVTMNGGYVSDFMEMWSRGYTGGAEMTLNGGTINKLFAGGDYRPDQNGVPSSSGRLSDATGGWVTLNLMGGTVQHFYRGLNVTGEGVITNNYNVSGKYRKGVVTDSTFDPAAYNLVKDDGGVDRDMLLGPDPDEEYTGAGFVQRSFAMPSEAQALTGSAANTNTPVLSVRNFVVNGWEKLKSTNSNLKAELDCRPATNNVVPYFNLSDSSTGSNYTIRVENGAITLTPFTGAQP